MFGIGTLLIYQSIQNTSRNRGGPVVFGPVQSICLNRSLASDP